VNLEYSANYWDNYYGGSYEDTYQRGFSMDLLMVEWGKNFENKPKSFADIGCGPGQTLKEAESALGSDARVYGVEVQPLPPARVVSDKIIFANFLDIYKRLDPVDLLYVACSMYIPWGEQEHFLKACLGLADRAVCFANVYLEDGDGIPDDEFRAVIYRDRDSFSNAIESLGDFVRVCDNRDFFIRTDKI